MKSDRKRAISRVLLAAAAIFIGAFCAPVVAAPFDYGKTAGYLDFLKEENEPPLWVEMFRVEIENSVGGPISVSEDGGGSWRRIGSTLAPCVQTNPAGFTASGWGRTGTVTATAVNALHIKTGQNEESGKGVIFSLLPKEFFEPPKDYKSYYSPSASLMTDIPAGTELFGGRWSPFVGSRVFLKDGAGGLHPIGEGYVPAAGDNITLIVDRPARHPKSITFDNRVGGKVVLRYIDGEEKIVGRLYRRLAGVGRFDGTLYAETGRIRAIHPGVIDISTTPIGQIGGFQIIPEMHSRSPEMSFALQLTQWMIVGPENESDPGLPGTAPLFNIFLRPVWFPITEPGALTDRFLVRARMKGATEWGRMPQVAGKVDDALDGVDAIRILFPVYPSFGPNAKPAAPREVFN